ncbi:MAG TPA: hypothetical protein VKF81_06035 [Blastocatellia bacterium]|nr:hypothetical protein [Blastocatellia bacterium]
MIYKGYVVWILFLVLIASMSAAAQSSVSLKPVIKVGAENRYVVNAVVDTRVTATGGGGIASDVHRETTATVLLRAVTNEKGLPVYQAVIEAILTHTSVDGIGQPGDEASLLGQRIEYRLDSTGQLAKASFPESATGTGLPELILSLTKWAPAGDVTVGQSWGTGAGDYGYIAAPGMAEVAKGAAVSYRLSSLAGGKALIEGTISLKQSGASLVRTSQGKLNVNAVATGKGSSRIEYDATAGHIISATTETSLTGRLANIPPEPEGVKLQPREGSFVENAKFSITLVQ